MSGHSNSGTTYNVSVTAQPSNPAQHCVVTGGSGNVTNANITSIGVSCKNVGKYVFVANPFDGNTGGGSVAAFAINPYTGVLTAATGSPYAAPGGDLSPFSVALDPAGGKLYVANSGSRSISTYAITGGALTPDSVSPVSTGAVTNIPLSLAMAASATGGPYLYAGSDNANANGTLEGFSVTGGLSALSGSPFSSNPASTLNTPFGLVVDSTNKFVYAADVYSGTVASFSIGSGGNLTELGSSPDTTLSAPYGVAAYPSGSYVYVTNQVTGNPGSVNLYSYNATTGALAFVQQYTVGGGPEGVTVDPSGAFLYVSNATDGTVWAFTINPANGHLSSVTGSPYITTGTASQSTPTALAVDPSSQFLYVANGDSGTISAFRINSTTGALTTIPGSPFTCILSGGGPAAIVIQ